MHRRHRFTWLEFTGVLALITACSPDGGGPSTGPSARVGDPSSPIRTHVATSAGATVKCTGFILVVPVSHLTVGTTYTLDYSFTLTPTHGGSTLTLPTGGGKFTFKAAVAAPTLTITGSWNLAADYTVTGSVTLAGSNVTVPITFGGLSSASLNCASSGCTFTQGYYKNHESVVATRLTRSSVYISGGKLLIGGSGLTASDIIANLETPPKGGNDVLILEHQLIAAELNIIGGASAPATVITAITQANTLLAAGEGSTQLADLLDRYNSGIVGPGECR
jgi:hypothetical protein